MSLLLLWLPVARASTWVVDPSGAGDAMTLAEGFALLSDGDTLEVAAGTYEEGEIDVSADDVTVLGAGRGETIMDGTALPSTTEEALRLLGNGGVVRDSGHFNSDPQDFLA